jgi:Rod binding domain-containing protein
MIDAINRSITPKDSGQIATDKGDSVTTQAPSEFSQKRLKKAVKDFEALFIFELLKAMRQTTHGGLMGKGLGNDVYNSLFDMEIAKLMADRGLGLGDMLIKQLEKRGGSGTTPAGVVSVNQDSNFKVEKRGLPSSPIQREKRDFPAAKGLPGGKDPKTSSDY